jgi:phosphohistidine phosphatase
VKTLLLLRHAKSDWDAAYTTDHERPLNDRGVRSARLIGRLLADRDQQPDLVISSTAVRARTTAQLAAEAGGWSAEIILDPDLYGSGAQGVLTVAAGAPDVERLMLVGHQPTWSSVVGLLTGSRVDIKTASVASIEILIDSWQEVVHAAGVLTYLINPRTFFGSEYDSG